jgi:hypothetical protein
MLTQFIEHLMSDWTAPIYAFFRPTPQIEYIAGRRAHVFECASGRCKARNGRDVRRFLDKGDRNSTSNLRKHAKVCWGDDAIAAADTTYNVDAAREILLKSDKRDGSITAEFQRIGKGKVSFSTRQHTKTEARSVFVQL